MKDLFQALAGHVQSLAAPGEILTSGFSGEDSHFIRFNRSAVRQATAVRQARWTLSLIDDGRRVDATTTLAGDLKQDLERLTALVSRLREAIVDAPKDPYLLLPDAPRSTEQESTGALPGADVVIDAVTKAGQGLDIVGLYAGGPVYHGYANSLGQRNWQRADNYHLEWCLYHDRDKAVKTSLSGAAWDALAFAARMARARDQVERLALPARSLAPGRYRAYLAPAAVKELLDMLCWGGFSVKSLRTKDSPLLRLSEGEQSLDPRITLRENTADGLAPGFQSDGFVRPGSVDLIRDGRAAQSLVSPRSAREYGLPTNGANADESPESLDLDGGDLPAEEALARLGTGLYIGNLWYLNFSDRTACRLTGMTRFACFWVQDGAIQAPLDVMRFDDTIYRLLGSQLEALTCERDLLPDGGTYGARNTASARVPGLLVRELTLTL